MTEKNADTMVIAKTVNIINAVIVRNLVAIGVSTRDCGEEKSVRLIDGDELMEHVYRDRLDSRELIAEMIQNAPTVKQDNELELMCKELKAHIEYLRRQNDFMKGEIKALTFAVRCGGISGSEVTYEID